MRRVFNGLFNELKNKKYPALDEQTTRQRMQYPHCQRVIGLVDRRKYKILDKQDKDPVYLYEPPSNCRNIPSDAVNEWYLNSSRTCLLPNMEYGDGKEAEQKSDNDANANNDNDIKHLKNANIGSLFHCKGAFMTFSFHVKARNEIKCY